ncbi:Radical SAM domain protein [Thermoanaerobacter ethanolicus JW 200]|uniref:Uncharacterized protein n=1 Tax=Caldanaerobacter subterraneus subsp. yonseiensis KB-1 TaxID=1388761 RepID=U5CP54_CALSX|nr:radical SAM protein [Caldanaerobacter subterraneus]EGD50870.1 Radical SAM domain protein [Thermoanaerobacter ethanolicus JW 200]ERM90731.1 hypothetical protein O163_14375 [Caldanaerobacter subterraneus subsp. yonseiensis KB-1]MBE3579925.1 B12-binding domain-containing radical SAM protein [Caldanaerobacter subterraneus]
MKVVLISPYFPSVGKNKEEHVSLGVLYLATEIQHLCKVYVFNALIDEMDEDMIVNKIKKISPDIVGISINFAPALNSGLRIADRLRKENFDGIIVFGGNTSTFLYKKILTESYGDIVVMYEGEHTFKELITILQKCSNQENFIEKLSGIRGIAFKTGKGEVITTQKREFVTQLDELKIPNRTYHDNFYKLSKMATILSSRGCPYSCFYCSTTAMWGRNWRGRSAHNIVAEIEYIRSLYPNICTFGFVDDNFLVDKKRAREFAELLISKNLDITFGFSARVEHLEYDLLKTLKKAGLSKIFLGIESGSPRILRLLHRNYTPYEVIEKVGYIENLGIKVTASFMVGIPFETKDDVDETFKLIKNIPASEIQCHIFTPFPGTPCFEKPDNFGVKLHVTDPTEISLDKKVYLDTLYLSKEEIELLHRRAISLIFQKRYINNLKNKIKN